MAFRRSSVQSRPAPPRKICFLSWIWQWLDYIIIDAFVKGHEFISLIIEDKVTRLSLFNSPFLLGFDDFERTIDKISKLSSDSYPPYNIEQISECTLRITIAVAGFEKKELDISLEGNQLAIRGCRLDSENERIFIHRGIAARQFQRNFVLADGIKVNGASMENGLLSIDLLQPKSQDKSTKIEINDAATNENKNLINLDLSAKNEQK